MPWPIPWAVVPMTVSESLLCYFSLLGFSDVPGTHMVPADPA